MVSGNFFFEDKTTHQRAVLMREIIPKSGHFFWRELKHPQTGKVVSLSTDGPKEGQSYSVAEVQLGETEPGIKPSLLFRLTNAGEILLCCKTTERKIEEAWVSYFPQDEIDIIPGGSGEEQTDYQRLITELFCQARDLDPEISAYDPSLGIHRL